MALPFSSCSVKRKRFHWGPVQKSDLSSAEMLPRISFNQAQHANTSLALPEQVWALSPGPSKISTVLWAGWSSSAPVQFQCWVLHRAAALLWLPLTEEWHEVTEGKARGSGLLRSCLNMGRKTEVRAWVHPCPYWSALHVCISALWNETPEKSSKSFKNTAQQSTKASKWVELNNFSTSRKNDVEAKSSLCGCS